MCRWRLWKQLLSFGRWSLERCAAVLEVEDGIVELLPQHGHTDYRFLKPSTSTDTLKETDLIPFARERCMLSIRVTNLSDKRMLHRLL